MRTNPFPYLLPHSIISFKHSVISLTPLYYLPHPLQSTHLPPPLMTLIPSYLLFHYENTPSILLSSSCRQFDSSQRSKPWLGLPTYPAAAADCSHGVEASTGASWGDNSVTRYHLSYDMIPPLTLYDIPSHHGGTPSHII